MRLFLVTSLVMTAILCLPYGLYKVTERWHPLVRLAYVAMCIGSAVSSRTMRFASRGMTLYPVDSPARFRHRGWEVLFEFGNWLDEVADPARWHSTAVLAHVVCDPCGELAPGWWEFAIDCAGHDCQRCLTCTDMVEDLPSAGHRSGH